MDRRTFGAAVASGIAASLAGCLSSDGPPGAPEIGDSRIEEDWTKTDESSGELLEEEIGPVTVTASEYTLVYENAAIRRQVRERTLDTLDVPLARLFVTKIDIDPAVDSLLGTARERLMDEVEAVGRQGFEDELQAQGIADVESVGERSIRTASGDEATVVEYDASYGIDDVSIEAVEGETITFEGREVAIDGWYAQWHDGDDAFVAGGAHPAENVEDTIEESLTDAMDLTVSIDLGLTPDEYEDELLDLVGSIR